MSRYQGFYYDVIHSTNEEAKRLLLKNQITSTPLGKPVFVISEAQSQGKGTQGRRWESPKNAGLYLSVVHTTAQEQPLALTDLYTRAAGLACWKTMRDVLGLQIELKPVNDLYVRCPKSSKYKKLGGILVESILQENAMRALITGIGINIANVPRTSTAQSDAHPDILPISLEEILDTPVFKQLGQVEFKQELLDELILNIDDTYQRLVSGEEETILSEYQAVCIAAV